MAGEGWRELAPGGLIDRPGCSEEYDTGSWRVFRPIFVPENCIHCLFCWIFCPDSAVLVEEGEVKGFDYDHCKGCGICERECPAKKPAILMEREQGNP